MNLSKNVKATLVQPSLGNGQATTDSASVDMQGFEGVVFIGIAGTVTGAGTVSLKASQSSDNGVFYDLSGVAAMGPAGGSDKFILLDVYRPSKRYVRTTLTRAVANSVYGGTIAIQYGSHRKPTIHDIATLAAALLKVSPAEV
jgi:hypothetical protein